MKINRRDFLARTGCQALGAAALTAGIDRLSLIHTLAAQEKAPADYRALVCIFLSGGNDANNMVVPADGSGYAAYNGVRGPAGLAIPLSSLLTINPVGLSAFGLHPQMPELATLFTSQKVAVVCNVGPLVEPLDRTSYLGSGRKPYQLFSHSDQVQEWQTSRADARTQVGWGGLTADAAQHFNGTNAFPIVTSVAGSSIFATGAVTRPLNISPAPTGLNQVLLLSGFSAAPEAVARKNSMDYLRTIDRGATLVAGMSDSVQQAINISQAFQTDPVLATNTHPFPNTSLGNQLKQVAKVMSLNQTSSALSLERQIFFCSIGGFDTHQTELSSHVSLYQQISQAMDAFYYATQDLGLANRVTTFTLSDFGRTLAPSGSGAATVGTDHGWGSHQFVMGGSVVGGRFYGKLHTNNTPFPTLQLGGPDDTDNRGRWIPKTAIEQYVGTLAAWFGLTPTDLSTVFPLLYRFSPANLGFV